MNRAARPVLIVNADDFGLCASVNQGIIRAHEDGIVTSTSLMVRQPAAEAAARYARANTRLGVGLHLDLGEMEYRDGHWVELYHVVNPKDHAAVYKELRAQLARFRKLVGRNPTHLDSHQHRHRDMPARQVATRIAVELNIPLRSISPHVNYVGDFYGQTNKGEPYHEAISPEALAASIRKLTPGTYEFGCHPGAAADVPSIYAAERPMEVATLCDPLVKAAAAECADLRSLAGIGSGLAPMPAAGGAA